MVRPVISNWPIFFGLTMIMVGNGLQGSLLGIRASIEGFSPFTTGVIMSCFYLGFLLGSRLSPRLIRDVGHIRVFAALASLASTTVLMHAIFVDPAIWALIRILTGFSYAGLYIVIESWLNDAATNKNRSKMMATYMILSYVGMICGQFLLNFAAPQDMELFVMTSVLVSLALMPISLSKRPAPVIKVPKNIRIRDLYAKSPLGLTSMAVAGMISSILFSIGAVYATQAGYSVSQTALFISMIILGGISSQLPIAWLSDRFDRRIILSSVTCLIAITAGFAFITPLTHMYQNYILIYILGGLGLSIYSLALAQTNDHLEKEEIMSASATMVLVNGLGACMSPMAVTALMGFFGPSTFFGTIMMIGAGMFAFSLYRIQVAPPVPQADQGTYIPVPIIRAASPMTASIMREMDEESTTTTDNE